MNPTLSRKFFLIVSATRNRYNGRPEGLMMPRLASSKHNSTPALKKGEVAIAINLELPTSLFKNPTYSATIAVDPGNVTPPTVEADVINNIEQVVGEATGLRLSIEQVPASDD